MAQQWAGLEFIPAQLAALVGVHVPRRKNRTPQIGVCLLIIPALGRFSERSTVVENSVCHAQRYANVTRTGSESHTTVGVFALSWAVTGPIGPCILLGTSFVMAKMRERSAENVQKCPKHWHL